MRTRSRTPGVITAAVLLFFHLPVLVLVLDSFNASRFAGRWGGWSLTWYIRLVREPAIWDAVRNTLAVAFAATLVSTLLGTSAAFALHRWRSRLQQMHHGLIVTPLVLPEILMGLSLLLFFTALKIELGLFTIFLAHVTFCISYVAMVVLARLQDFDFTIVDAARDLGATGWTILRRVLLPLLAPGIAAGALLAFTLSLDDFVITFFVSGKGSTTLPVLVYSLIKHGSTPLINALSTLLLAATALLVWSAQRLLADPAAER
jgi:spermidine/putrescine transport system permease protein